MPTCGAPIDAVHLVPQGMGAFTYVIRCDCGLSFDTGAQSEAAAADRWNERPAPDKQVMVPRELLNNFAVAHWGNWAEAVRARAELRALLDGAPK